MDKLRAINELGCGPVAIDSNGNVTAINNQPLPTEEQIQAKIAELQAEYEANAYQRQRAAEYPSWQDQLDNIFTTELMPGEPIYKPLKINIQNRKT